MSGSKLHLLVVQPASYRAKNDRTLLKTRRRQVVPLTLPYLAALTPPEWDVTLVDEQVQDVDFDGPWDLVALSVWTVNSLRAYDLAAEFRRRGKPVIMGGPHTFFYEEEAAEHCDAVGIGEGEAIFRQMLQDAAAKRLQKKYRAGLLVNLNGLPIPRWELLDMRKYGPFRTFAIQTSRGCPFNCDFCSERFYLGARYRCRPVAEIVEEIRRCGSRQIFFADSNFGGSRSHAMELMEALIPLKIRWSALWSMYLCRDEKFMQLAKRSGLLHVNLGMESINPETLRQMNKRINKVEQYEEALATLRRLGISYSLNFIFGWDGEGEETWQATLEFLLRNKVPAAYFNILTPEKGTALYDRMLSQGRILNREEIGRWPGQICYIQPKNMTPAQLEQKVQQLYRQFYGWRSIWKRLPLPRSQSDLASWVVNISQRKMANASTEANNFAPF
jgi:radical SAM superfamily enzyme YgiQ (UPF0313 family)